MINSSKEWSTKIVHVVKIYRELLCVQGVSNLAGLSRSLKPLTTRPAPEPCLFIVTILPTPRVKEKDQEEEEGGVKQIIAKNLSFLRARY